MSILLAQDTKLAFIARILGLGDAGLNLFVYGTLLTVADHAMGALLRAHSRFVGSGSIQARLYIIDDPDAPGENSYPGALPAAAPQDRVWGDVYHLDNPSTVLPAFDDYEACSDKWPEPHEFMLRRVTVRMKDGSELGARSYLYTWDVSGAQRVPSGRWTQVARDVR